MKTSKSPNLRLRACFICAVSLALFIVAVHPLARAQNANQTFQAFALRHAQAAEIEPQVVRLLAGLPDPAEVIADPRNNRLLVRGSAAAHQMVEQLLRTIDRPMETGGGEAVLKAYPFGGDIAAKTRELQATFGMRPGVRIAFDSRTSQILALAPADVQAQLAAQLGQPTAPAATPAPMAAAPAGQVARPLSVPSAAPRQRSVILKNSTWEQVQQSLGKLVRGQVRSVPSPSPEQTAHVLTMPDQSEVHFQVHRGTGVIEVSGNPSLVESCVRLVQVLDAPQALKNPNQQVLPLSAAKQPTVRRAVQLLEAAEMVRQPAAAGAPPTSSVVRPLPPGSPKTPPAVPLVAQLFQQGQEQSPAPNAPQPNQPGQPLAVPAPPGGLPPGLTSGLVGSVQIEIIEGLDVIIITGNERDVQRVAQIIEQIEELADVTAPIIEVHELQHANSDAVAALITQFYDQVLLPRLGRVSITPLQKPNALLLIGRDESVKFVKELIQSLDVPVAPSTQFAVFPLKHASAASAQATITQFFTNRTGLGPKVVVTSEFRTNSLIVQASPRDMAEVTELIERIDVAQTAATDELRVFPLQNSLADELAPVLQEAINGQGAAAGGIGGLPPLGPAAGGAAPPGAAGGSGRSSMLKFMTIDAQGQRELASSGILTDVRITADPRANALLVAGPANAMPLIEALIRQLDQIPAAESQIKVFSIVNGDAQLMITMLQALFGQQQQAGGGGGLFGAGGAGGAAQGFLGENPLVSMRFAVDLRTNSIIASGSAKDLLIVEAILLRLDASDVRQRQSIVYRLKNAPALAVAQTINDFLQSERNVQNLVPEQISPFQQIEREVVVVPEQVSNSLIVSATPRYFEEIRKIVEELDERPPMVMIQVMIGEVALNNTDEFGVELGLQDSVLFDRSLLGDIVTTSVSTQQAVPGGGTITTTDQIIQAATLNPGFNFNNQPLGNSGSTNSLGNRSQVGTQGLTNFSVGRVNGELGFGGLVLSASSDAVSILIRALKECRRLEVLSRPQVMTLDNQPAFIQVGARVPRIQGVTLGQFGQTNNVLDVNVGIILGVTPRISPDGLVVMEIDAERSALGPESEGVPISTSTTGEVVRQPLINTTTAQTTVSAADGQTVVLGGLLTKETSKTRRRVPLLSSIPIVGNLFRYDQDFTRRTELLIILTPRIVRNEADADIVKQAEAARMSWCLGDVRKLHGDPGIYSRDGEWFDGQTMVIHPDQTPLGVEAVPTPAAESILPPGVILPPGAVVVPEGAMQGPSLLPPPQPTPPGAPVTPPPPRPGPPAPVPQLPPPAAPQQNTLPQQGAAPPAAAPTLAAPQQQGPSLAPIPANPDQARYGPPPPPGYVSGRVAQFSQPANGGPPQNVRAAYYQQPVAARR